MKYCVLVVSLGCCLLAACNSAESQAKEDFRQQMIDPDSAKFGRFDAKGDKACLEVNGKNSFGGYTGMKTAFLRQGKDGKWAGFTDPSNLLSYDFCLKDLAKTD